MVRVSYYRLISGGILGICTHLYIQPSIINSISFPRPIQCEYETFINPLHQYPKQQQIPHLSSIQSAWTSPSFRRAFADQHKNAFTQIYQPQTSTESTNETRTQTILRTVVSHVISQVAKGKHLSEIRLPLNVQQPISALEKSARAMQCGEIVAQFSSLEISKEDRFLNVLKFFFSGLPQEPFGQKPLNPILGEVFRAQFKHKDGSKSQLISEQIEISPPTSAIHISNPIHGFSMTSFAIPTFQLSPNALHIQMKGLIQIHLNKFNEIYSLTRPVMTTSGILGIGKQEVYFSGNVLVNCKESGLNGIIEFAVSDDTGSVWNSAFGLWKSRSNNRAVKGEVVRSEDGKVLYRIDGEWDGKVWVVNEDSGNRELLFDRTQELMEHENGGSKMETYVPEKEYLEGNNSLIVWNGVKKLMLEGDFESAVNEQLQIESEQRMYLLQQQKEQRWQPAFFKFYPESGLSFIGNHQN